MAARGLHHGRGLDRSRSPRHINGSGDWTSVVAQDWRRLMQAPAEIRDNLEVICNAVRESNGRALEYASEELRGDQEFISGAVQEIGPAVLAYAAPELQADRAFIFALAQEIGASVLQHASEDLRSDRDFMLEVADFCPPGEVLQNVSENIRQELLSDREFLLQAVMEDGAEILEHASAELRGDRDFIEAVAEHCPPGEALQYASDEVRRVLYADRVFMLQGIQAVGEEVLQYASEELRAELIADPTILEHGISDAKNNDLCTDTDIAVDDTVEVVEDKPAPDDESAIQDEQWKVSDEVRTAALLTLKESGVQALETASSALRGDLQFMLAASQVGCSVGEVLWYAHDSVRETLFYDEAFVLKAVGELGPSMLERAPASIRSKPALVLTAIRDRDASVLEYVAPELRTDRNFLLKAVQEIGAEVLAHAGGDLRGDRTFVLEVADFCSLNEALRHASPEIRDAIQAEIAAGMTPALEPKESRLPDDEVLQENTEEVANITDESVVQNAEQEAAQDDDSVEFVDPPPPESSAVPVCEVEDEGVGVPMESDIAVTEEEAPPDKQEFLTRVHVVGAKALEGAPLSLRGDLEFMLAASAAGCSAGEILSHATDEILGALHSDKSFMLKSVREAGVTALELTSAELRSDAHFMSAAGTCCPCADVLRLASEVPRARLLADRTFMIRAVHEMGVAALDYAPAELLADRSFMLRAVRKLGTPAFERAATNLRDDRHFMLGASSYTPHVLRYASEKLRNELYADKAFMLKAIQKVGPQALMRSSATLLDDKSFMWAAAACCPPMDVFRCASVKIQGLLKGDRPFVLKLIKDAGASAMEGVSKELRSDLGFMMEVAELLGGPAEAMKYATEELREELECDD